jgi:plasmid rolling circle replication initiator protein Rep
MKNQTTDEYIKIELDADGRIISVSEKLIETNEKNKTWRNKKVRNQLYAKSLERIKLKKKQRFKISKKTINRIADCAGVLAFSVSDEGQSLHQAFLCRNRYCPICSWLSSRKLAADNYKILNKFISEDDDNRLIFLTLTIRNCNGVDLKATINRLNAGFRNLRKRKLYQANFLGDLRALEITVNKNNLTFHPHLHVILGCKKDYFSKHNPYYINAPEWAKMWAECIKQDKAIIDVRKVKDKEIGNATAEISKYVTKDSDYLLFKKTAGKVVLDSEKTDYIIYHLINQTKGLRFINYAGVFRNIKRELKIKNIEDYDESDLIEEDTNVSVNSRLILLYRWNYGVHDYTFFDFYKQ